MEILSHGSFPRSGNHLLDTVLKFSYPSCNVMWIEHNAWVSSKVDNFICVVRDPIEAISSWILLTSDNRYDRSDRLLDWYIRYHEFMLNKDNALLVDFNQLINNTSYITDIIFNTYGVRNTNDIPKNFYHVYMGISYPDNSPSGSSEDRERICDEIKKSSNYKDAKKIYKNILKRIKYEF